MRKYKILYWEINWRESDRKRKKIERGKRGRGFEKKKRLRERIK